MAMLRAKPCARSGVHLIKVARTDGAAGAAAAWPMPTASTSAAMMTTACVAVSDLAPAGRGAESRNGLSTGRSVAFGIMTACNRERAWRAPSAP